MSSHTRAIQHLAIGRRISEYISKAHNARVRADAYRAFIELIRTNRKDFTMVWGHRMADPRKRMEGDAFLQMLRTHTSPLSKTSSSPALKHALTLLSILEKVEPSKEQRSSQKSLAYSTQLV